MHRLLVFLTLLIPLFASAQSVYMHGDALLGVAGDGTAAGGRRGGDDEVGGARVAEMEAVADALACREAPEVVEIVVEGDDRHRAKSVVACGALGIADEVDIEVATLAAATCRQQQYRYKKKNFFHKTIKN